jgi:hypothetical protein
VSKKDAIRQKNMNSLLDTSSPDSKIGIDQVLALLESELLSAADDNNVATRPSDPANDASLTRGDILQLMAAMRVRGGYEMMV